MCKAMEDMRNRALKEGIEIGEARMILGMHKQGFSAEKIALIADKDVDAITAIIERKELVGQFLLTLRGF